MEDIDRELPDLVALQDLKPASTFIQADDPRCSYSLLNAGDLRLLCMPELAVTFEAGFCTHENWIWREGRRFNTGEYAREAETGHSLGRLDLKILPGQFLHLSKEDPRLVAYTPTPAHGREDRQVRTTLGKYLTRYQAELGLSASDVGRLTRSWNNSEKVHFSLLSDADDIQYVYDHGPDSCMKELGNPAVQAYAGPDTALAVMWQGCEEDGIRGAFRISARCVVSTRNKQYVRIYSDCDAEDQLEAWLQEQGFAYDRWALKGCRLIAQAGDGVLFAPYLDGAVSCGSFEGGYIFLGRDDLDLQNADGMVVLGTECADCGYRYDEARLTRLADGRLVCAGCLDSYRLAYNGSEEEWVPDADVVGYDGRDVAYTQEGADYWNMVVPNDTNFLVDMDECVETQDHEFYLDPDNAISAGYFQTLDGVWILEADMESKGYRKAVDDEWVPENLAAYGYVEIEDPEDELETLVVPVEGLAEYGLALRNGRVVPKDQLELVLPEVAHEQALAA